METKEFERVRAWILIRADEPELKAHRIYDVMGYKEGEGDDAFVLIRADVVDFHYNIMIPVDAASLQIVQEKLCEIQTLAEAREIAIVPVTEHIPYPPHMADGYISPEEAEIYTDPEPMKVGRQRKSPGVNPWG